MQHDGKLPQRIKDYRERYYLTQTQIAKHLGVCRTTYARYESGKSPIRFGHCLSLADLYKVPYKVLIGDLRAKGAKEEP